MTERRACTSSIGQPETAARYQATDTAQEALPRIQSRLSATWELDGGGPGGAPPPPRGHGRIRSRGGEPARWHRRGICRQCMINVIGRMRELTAIAWAVGKKPPDGVLIQHDRGPPSTATLPAIVGDPNNGRSTPSRVQSRSIAWSRNTARVCATNLRDRLTAACE